MLNETARLLEETTDVQHNDRSSRPRLRIALSKHEAGELARRFLELVRDPVPGRIQRQPLQVARHIHRLDPISQRRGAERHGRPDRRYLRRAVHLVFDGGRVSGRPVQQTYGGHRHQGCGGGHHGPWTDRSGSGPHSHPPHRRVTHEHPECLLRPDQIWAPARNSTQRTVVLGEWHSQPGNLCSRHSGFAHRRFPVLPIQRSSMVVGGRPGGAGSDWPRDESGNQPCSSRRPGKAISAGT